jgi:hypothetical protein
MASELGELAETKDHVASYLVYLRVSLLTRPTVNGPGSAAGKASLSGKQAVKPQDRGIITT